MARPTIIAPEANLSVVIFALDYFRGFIDRTEWFLIDTGSDQTVLSGATRFRLGVPARVPDEGYRLMGIGGASYFVLITTEVDFTRDDGQVVRMRGDFAALTDPAATDFSVLGHDVLDNFDLIVSPRKGEIWLLTGTHRYRVESK